MRKEEDDAKSTDRLPLRGGVALNEQDEIFTVKARRCRRCGGLLTSKQAVEDGYGHVCKMKTNAEIEAAKPDVNQLTLFDEIEEQEDT